jgi:pimeloyl-ACP methyl ester carboxylesterase
MIDPTRAFADIDGLRLYYEIHGSGRPLVLLHGGLLTIDFMFGPILPTLAARRQVIAVELQGHGRTADTDRPMSIDQLADDVDVSWWVTPSSYDAGYYTKAHRALRTWLAAEYPFWNGYFSNKEIPDDDRSPSA